MSFRAKVEIKVSIKKPYCIAKSDFNILYAK